MTRGAVRAIFQSLPDLNSQTLKQLPRAIEVHSALLTVDVNTNPPIAPGEWNGNNNDRAFLMVGASAYPFLRRTGLTRGGCTECLPA
jgi:hypothetical protein